MSKFSNLDGKLKAGAAAFAMAGAAAMAPGAVAHASPAVPLPAAGVGSGLEAVCEETDTGDCLSPFAGVAASASASANLVPAVCTTAICFGEGLPAGYPALPEKVVVLDFNLIPLLPEAIQPVFYGFWEDVNPNGFSACFGGVGGFLDSYSTLSLGIFNGCSGT